MAYENIEFSLFVLRYVAKPRNEKNPLAVNLNFFRFVDHLHIPAFAEYVYRIDICRVFEIRIVVAADKIKLPVFRQRLNKFQ